MEPKSSLHVNAARQGDAVFSCRLKLPIAHCLESLFIKTQAQWPDHGDVRGDTFGSNDQRKDHGSIKTYLTCYLRELGTTCRSGVRRRHLGSALYAAYTARRLVDLWLSFLS